MMRPRLADLILGVAFLFAFVACYVLVG